MHIAGDPCMQSVSTTETDDISDTLKHLCRIEARDHVACESEVTSLLSTIVILIIA